MKNPPTEKFLTAMSNTDESPVEFKEITLKVQLPGSLKNNTLEISSLITESINDLRQALLILPSTRCLTNYDLYFKGVNVSEEFDEMTTYEDFLKTLGESTEVTELSFSVKEKAYNLAKVYEHILRFREVIGLHYFDRISQEFGGAAGCTKFNDLGLADLKLPEPKPENTENKSEKSEETEPRKLTEEELKSIVEISEEIIAADKIELSKHAHFSSFASKTKVPIKSLTVSQWSPVPAFQKTKGDLLYLTLQTLENEVFNITCHISGFFVNKSSSANFNPAVKHNEKGSAQKSYLLYNLLETLSPKFSKTIQDNEVSLSASTSHPESYLLANRNLSAPWLVNEDSVVNLPDLSRFELPLLANGVDGSGYIKDWNEDIQAIRELPNESFQDRILKEKIIHKSLADFTRTATETAINIIKGNLSPMDPNEDADKQIYLKNGIFYTSGATTADLFEQTGGVEASRYTSNKDISAIKVLNRIDAQGVHSLVSCIVDYMGKRVVCQAPVPGIFNQSPDGDDEKVAYGLSSDSSKILFNESFNEPMKQIADTFHLKSHEVTLGADKVELAVSKETKGIFGTDGRKYVIDLFRTVPRDIAFTEENYNPSESTSYPHGESLLRHEAIADWWKRNIAEYIKKETENGKSEEELAQLELPTDKYVFNPDAESKDDLAVIRELSVFVKETLISEYLKDITNNVAPFDGRNLTESLHKSGINMRYLGYIVEQAVALKADALKQLEEAIKKNEDEAVGLRAKAKEEAEAKAKEIAEKAKKAAEAKAKGEPYEEEKETKETKEETEEKTKATFEPVFANYSTLIRVCIQEMIARSSKHLLRKLSSSVPSYLMPSFVAHFHNCLLGTSVNSHPEADVPADLKEFVTPAALEFTKLTPGSVAKLISQEVYSRFRYTLNENWISEVNPVQLMREIAHKFGIQWKSQDYAFTAEEFSAKKVEETPVVVEQPKSKNSKKGKKQANTKTVSEKVRNTVFTTEDVVNFVPLVKDSDYKSAIVDEIFQTARAHIVQGDKDTGISLLNELINIQEQIYGVVSAETVSLYTLIAQLFAELGMEYQAALIARRAIVISERTTGFDSYDTITAYMNSGFFESSQLELVNSMKLYKQAIDNWSFVYGRDHPIMVTTLSNLADNLTRLKLYSEASKFYELALELSIKLNGKISEITGSMYQGFALVLLNAGKFDESLEHFTTAADIFTKTIGFADPLTKRANNYVDNITKYMEYLAAQEELKKKQVQQKAAATGNKKVLMRPSSQDKKSSQNKKNVVKADPEIASRSVDDILKFIEGDE